MWERHDGVRGAVHQFEFMQLRFSDIRDESSIRGVKEHQLSVYWVIGNFKGFRGHGFQVGVDWVGGVCGMLGVPSAWSEWREWGYCSGFFSLRGGLLCMYVRIAVLPLERAFTQSCVSHVSFHVTSKEIDSIGVSSSSS